MSESVIRVNKLGKKYKIAKPQSYQTLTETIGGYFKRVWEKKELNTYNSSTFWALRNISFEIGEGEVIGIIGRNGAGKSTLLKILSRITPPTEGSLELHGRIGSLLEVGTGFHPELSGRENVYLSGSILGMHKWEINEKFDEIIKFAEIERFIDTPVKRYSSGMYIRLAFAVAAHLETEILLVDEVLAVGDIAFQKKCLKKMGEAAIKGRTVLFVSHNMGAISRLCNRCLLLDKGNLVLDGATDDVIQKYVSMSETGKNEYLQSHNPGKKINLRRVSLQTNEGQLLTSEIKYSQDFEILIDYEVNNPVRDCLVWFAIETIDGIMVFTSADYDTNPSMLEEREPGFYQSRIRIPGKWLNYGTYIIIVGIVQNNPLEIFDRIESIKFSVLEIESPSSLHQAGTRRGILQPVLLWNNRKISI